MHRLYRNCAPSSQWACPSWSHKRSCLKKPVQADGCDRGLKLWRRWKPHPAELSAGPRSSFMITYGSSLTWRRRLRKGSASQSGRSICYDAQKAKARRRVRLGNGDSDRFVRRPRILHHRLFGYAQPPEHSRLFQAEAYRESNRGDSVQIALTKTPIFTRTTSVSRGTPHIQNDSGLGTGLTAQDGWRVILYREADRGR